MKAILFLYTIAILFILSTPRQLFSQQESDALKYSIETLDGNEYVGHVLNHDSTLILFRTANIGDISIRQQDIKNIIELDEARFKNGKYWHEMFQASRYFWSPNGYGLNKGEGYYQNVWILYNHFSYGITDNFSIGAGIAPLFLFNGASTPLWLIPKFSIPVVKDKFNIGIGALAGNVFGEKEGGFGIVYGVNTIGSQDRNLTLGVGWGYAAGSWAEKPVITLSGMIRVGPKGYLLTENFYIDTGDEKPTILLMFGGRSMVRKVGIDYGLLIPSLPDNEVFLAIPWLGITIPLGIKPRTKI